MKNVLISNILDTDSYKFSQYLQYPEDMVAMYSYFESRGGKYDKTLFFGLQYYLKKYLTQRITVEMVKEAKEFAEMHGVPFNYEGWIYIAVDLEGKLPVRINAVPEGMVVPKHNVLMTIESTDEKVPWVVNWLETMMVRMWYPITVATNSYYIKQTIMPYLEKTVDNPEEDLGFKLNDFGSRGATSQESAMLGGASHLVNFIGSDTVAGVWMANKYYNHTMSGFSIPASEHSTITSWGKENESKAYENMLDKFGDGMLVACVSDSYDYFNAVDNIWGKELKEKVEEMNATLVVRPDSGDPKEMVMYAVNSLAESFGYTVNSKGYKVLNNVKVIQGDGIDIDDVDDILKELTSQGYSAECVNFGMGGGLLQKNLNRDTHKFAFKCSWIKKADGTEVEVFKSPVTDKGKKSKKGRLILVPFYGDKCTIEVETLQENSGFIGVLNTIFENGEIVYEYCLEEIRFNTEVTIEKR